MIPIKYSKAEKTALNSWYLSHINSLRPKNKFDSIKNTIEKYLLTFGLQAIKFDELLIADIEMLTKIKKVIDLYNETYTCYNKKKVMPNERYIGDNEEMRFIYNTFDKIDKNSLVAKIGVNVCPYCNESYIHNRGTRTTAQFDHFFPRSQYPLLAICLYNLIPCCYGCNSIKSSNMLDLSPYEKNLSSDKYYVFSYTLRGRNFLTNASLIDINIRETSEGKKRKLNNKSILKLDNAYTNHILEVQELLKKKKVYRNNKMSELVKKFPELFPTQEHLENLIFGEVINGDESKRPITKLLQDIYKQK